VLHPRLSQHSTIILYILLFYSAGAMGSDAKMEHRTFHSSGRLRAVLSVIGASFSLFCTVGFLNAFGVFQQHYKADLLQAQSESDISWIGSVAIFFLYAFAPITGVLVDRFGPKVGCQRPIFQLLSLAYLVCPAFPSGFF